MPEWLVEQGIGEDRAILLDGETIVAARLDWPEGLKTGLVEDARLISRASGSSRGTARFANGEEALVDRLPATASEGATIRIRIIRPATAESGRIKLARARPTEEPPHPAPTLVESLRTEGAEARIVRRFPVNGWEDVLADAFTRQIAFPGGSLLLSPTPAMTLIDVDGALPATALALAAVKPVADLLRRLDIGGSVGIDFPTLPAKADRRAVDEALENALTGWPHERTAMNGFGFVQLVARLQRVPIAHRVVHSPARAAARLLLRRAEALDGAGAILLVAHPAVKAQTRPEWQEELSRRAGREIRWATEPGLAIEAGHAQLIER